MENPFDISAVLLDQETKKKLNMLLSPADTLERDVRTLSGILGFFRDEVLYIFKKQYPFVYMHDQWIKRDPQKATLQTLKNALIELKRLDAAEIVETAILEIQYRDPKEVLHEVTRLSNNLRRHSSTTTLCTTPETIVTENILTEASSEQTLDSSPVPASLQNMATDSSEVFVVYFPDDEKHVSNVKKFVKQLRRKYKINASADLFESEKHASDRGFYYYSKLIQAEFVFVVCSPLFLASYEHEKHPGNQEISQQVKDVSFVMKLILDEIYVNGGANAKYIPVLMPKSTEENVPFILKCSTIYKLRQDYDNLVRRVQGIEKYKLAPVTERKIVLQAKSISPGGFDIFRLAVRKYLK